MKDWYLIDGEGDQFVVIRRYLKEDEDTLKGTSRLFRGMTGQTKTYASVILLGKVGPYSRMYLINEPELLKHPHDREYYWFFLNAIKIFKLREKITNFVGE